MLQQPRNGDDRLLTCPTCDRAVVLGWGKFEVVTPGDYMTEHQWTSGGVTMGETRIR